MDKMKIINFNNLTPEEVSKLGDSLRKSRCAFCRERHKGCKGLDFDGECPNFWLYMKQEIKPVQIYEQK